MKRNTTCAPNAKLRSLHNHQISNCQMSAKNPPKSEFPFEHPQFHCQWKTGSETAMCYLGAATLPPRMYVCDAVDGRNPAPPGIYTPCKSWENPPINWSINSSNYKISIFFIFYRIPPLRHSNSQQSDSSWVASVLHWPVALQLTSGSISTC